MTVEHVALWTFQLEVLRDFYETYFDARANQKYISKNTTRGRFESYFLSFDAGARLELMTRTDIPQGDNRDGMESTGLTHIAFCAGTVDKVDQLYRRCKQDGIPIVGEPRITGDGYYEFCVLDPDGNRIEITATP